MTCCGWLGVKHQLTPTKTQHDLLWVTGGKTPTYSHQDPPPMLHLYVFKTKKKKMRGLFWVKKRQSWHRLAFGTEKSKPFVWKWPECLGARTITLNARIHFHGRARLLLISPRGPEQAKSWSHPQQVILGLGESKLVFYPQSPTASHAVSQTHRPTHGQSDTQADRLTSWGK